MFESIVVLLLIFMISKLVKTLINPIIVGEQIQSNSTISYHDGHDLCHALPLPASLPDSSLVHVVSEHMKSGPHLSTLGKASGKVIIVRNQRTQSNSVTISHGGDGSVTAAVSTCRESCLQVCTPDASNISESSSQVVAGPIPLTGPTIQAAIDTLSTTIETIDIHHHHMGVVDGLTSRLSQLRRCLRNTPAARNGPEEYEVASEMQSTSDRLRKLDKRSIFAKQAIIGCSKKLQEYLDHYKFTIIEGREIQVQQFGTSDATHIPRAVMSGSLILTDATGHQREIPFEFGMSRSLEQLEKILKSFFAGESKEARIQRHYMEQDQYDLCIDQGRQVTVLTSRGDEWPTMEPGMNIVMRVVSEKGLKVNSPIQCDSCRSLNFSIHSVHINDDSSGWSIECRECKRRHQLSASFSRLWSHGRPYGIFEDEMRHLIHNTHIREVWSSSYSEGRYVRDLVVLTAYTNVPLSGILRKILQKKNRFPRASCCSSYSGSTHRGMMSYSQEAISQQADHIPQPPW